MVNCTLYSLSAQYLQPVLIPVHPFRVTNADRLAHPVHSTYCTIAWSKSPQCWSTPATTKKLSLCNMELSWGPEIMMMEVEPETLKKNQRQTKLTRRQRGIFFLFFKTRQTSQCLKWVHYFYIYRYAYKSRHIDVTLFIIHLFLHLCTGVQLIFELLLKNNWRGF